MILVDSSIWIGFFNGTQSPETDTLDQLLDSGLSLVGDLILAEVLQGFRTNSDAAQALTHFGAFEFRHIGGRDLGVAAARNYRLLRGIGATVGETIDSLIATFCITEGHELLHCDRDFDPFERHLGLRVVST